MSPMTVNSMMEKANNRMNTTSHFTRGRASRGDGYYRPTRT
jgi:hypothetical protein